ncbi:hypothetical protein ACQRBN_16775 [Bariatricus sp. SGI.154]|uniref:hypothetical protein n=1 Tax=Bariatricus sp. SGI.154 TaxID=3420549 RepID=UPI003D053BD3
MATAVLRTNVYRNANKKEFLWNKFMNLSKVERASIICGLLSMNGSANVYPLYKALTE